MVVCVDVALKAVWLQFTAAELNLTLCPRKENLVEMCASRAAWQSLQVWSTAHHTAAMDGQTFWRAFAVQFWTSCLVIGLMHSAEKMASKSPPKQR